MDEAFLGVLSMATHFTASSVVKEITKNYTITSELVTASELNDLMVEVVMWALLMKFADEETQQRIMQECREKIEFIEAVIQRH